MFRAQILCTLTLLSLYAAWIAYDLTIRDHPSRKEAYQALNHPTHSEPLIQERLGVTKMIWPKGTAHPPSIITSERSTLTLHKGQKPTEILLGLQAKIPGPNQVRHLLAPEGLLDYNTLKLSTPTCAFSIHTTSNPLHTLFEGWAETAQLDLSTPTPVLTTHSCHMENAR